MRTVNFNDQLERQIRFIEASCKNFDEGHKDEAIRIGTCLRVIFHQTSSSTSLLTHLNAPTTQLLSTSTINSPGLGFCNNSTNAMLNPFTNEMWAEPWLDSAPNRRTINHLEWWSGEIMFSRDSVTVSRKDLSLWAANKDGGAHVDQDPGADYETVRKGMDFLFALGKPDGSSVLLAISDLHLAALRQSGYEILNSPELLLMAGRS